jgi:hypothetical protein
MINLIHGIAACLNGTSAILSQVPKEVWAAVIAAVIAATIAAYTTAKSNKNARRMIEIQLEHAAQQAEQKRKMDLRREVYFPAVKAVTNITSTIGALTDVRIPDDKIREAYATALAEIAGVHIVGSSRTLSAVIAMNLYAANLYLDFTFLRAKLSLEAQKLNSLSAIETSESQNGTALLEMMKRHNLSGGAPDQWARIQTQWEIHRKILEDHALKRTAQQGIVLQATSEMLNQFGERIEDLIPLQAKAMIAVREELGLPMDETEYLKFIEQSKQAVREATKKGAEFLASVKVQQDCGKPVAEVETR